MTNYSPERIYPSGPLRTKQPKPEWPLTRGGNHEKFNFRGFLVGVAFSLCACATPASVDLTKDKADRLQQEQAEQKQKIEKLKEEQQQTEKQKMQEQIDKLKKQQ